MGDTRLGVPRLHASHVGGPRMLRGQRCHLPQVGLSQSSLGLQGHHGLTFRWVSPSAITVFVWCFPQQMRRSLPLPLPENCPFWNDYYYYGIGRMCLGFLCAGCCTNTLNKLQSTHSADLRRRNLSQVADQQAWLLTSWAAFEVLSASCEVTAKCLQVLELFVFLCVIVSPFCM